LNEIGSSEIVFNKYIDFEREIFFNDDFTRKVGTKILDIINKDFRWNLFFKIIFEIKEGDNADEFEGFLIYLRYLFCDRIMKGLMDKELSGEEKEEIVEEIMDSIANNFNREIDIDFINECNIGKLTCIIKNLLKQVKNYDDWIANKDSIKDSILNYKF
jgi:hypothetical protein